MRTVEAGHDGVIGTECRKLNHSKEPLDVFEVTRPGDAATMTAPANRPLTNVRECSQVPVRHTGPVQRPLLLVDIDGVLSLFGFPADRRPPGAFHSIDGTLHYLSASAGAHLRELGESFDLVWCSGWEERANDHLPHLLGLPGPLPFLHFERSPGRAHAHWKLDAIDAYAAERPLAWVDDALDDACERWAAARQATGDPTLLVRVEPQVGLTGAEVAQLRRWAAALA
jgi:hypothetical protein